jgi:ABC-2 type transport system permease protein
MVANWFDRLWHDARMYRRNLAVQLRAAVALRGAFITQVIGMMISNVGLMITWVFFFERFGTVNGWGAVDFMGMIGVNALVFGIATFLSAGLMDLPRHVDSGSLDSYLTKPTAVLPSMASSTIVITTVGDILFGLGIVIWYGLHTGVQIQAVLPFVLIVAIGCAIFWCFVLLLPNVLAFYLYDSEKIGRYLGVFFLNAGEYPSGMLKGAFRTFLLLVVPALFYAAVPLDVLRSLQWPLIGLGALVAVVWCSFGIWLFRRALRRYESANLVGAR